MLVLDTDPSLLITSFEGDDVKSAVIGGLNAWAGGCGNEGCGGGRL